MTTASQPEGKVDGRIKMPIAERQERFRTYIERIEAGDTKGEACKAAGVSWGSLCRWVADDTNTLEDETGKPLPFAAHLARARINRGEGYADRAQVEVQQADTDDWQVRKMRADYYRWRASVSDRAGYGDAKQEVNVSISLGALHLDALRKVSASAKLVEVEDAKLLPSNDIG